MNTQHIPQIIYWGEKKNKLSYEEHQLNTELVFHANKIRPAVEAWAKAQSSSVNAAYARSDFENAVLEAVIGRTAEWQYYTNAELCSALGHNTLVRVVVTIYDGDVDFVEV